MPSFQLYELADLSGLSLESDQHHRFQDRLTLMVDFLASLVTLEGDPHPDEISMDIALHIGDMRSDEGPIDPMIDRAHGQAYYTVPSSELEVSCV